MGKAECLYIRCMKRVLMCLLLLIPVMVGAQKCDQVLVSGRVLDTLRPQYFYNLMVINRTSGRGVFGQPSGSFSVYASNHDSITLSVKGYPPVQFIVEADSNCQFRRNYIIEGKAQELKEVAVTPLKSLEEIKEERAALALRETRQVTGIEVIQSPITALYEAFSKKAKSRRWIAEQEYKDDQERVLRELLRLYVSYDIVDLSDEEFRDFIEFLNVDDTFLKTASEMELITFIKDKYEHYRMLTPKPTPEDLEKQRNAFPENH